jgi:hypothetical protein
VAAAVHLETAMMEHTYSHPDPAEKQIKAAKKALQIDLKLTGVMGKRTVHQVRSLRLSL